MNDGLFDLLGWRVKDRVTGFTGVVTHVGLDLVGCLQAIVHPGTVKDEPKLGDSIWFDVSRLEKVGKAPVMPPVPMKEVAPEPRTLQRRVAGAEANKPVK